MIRELSIDIETYSSEDLSRSGVYRYAEAPDFSVLLFGWSADGGPVSVVDLASGAMLPGQVLSALLDGGVVKWAFNAAFERVCLSRYLRDLGLLAPGEFLPPESWRCSMVWCGCLGLPMSLSGAGDALRLENRKLEEGKDLIRYFCRPAKPSLLAQDGRHRPFSSPSRWREFMEYNRRDVEVEGAVKERLRKYPVPDFLWEQYAMDQRVNDRGIRADLDLVDAALRMDAASRAALAAEMKERTALANPSSVAQVRSWLEQHGQQVDSLGKKQVAELLRSVPEEVREVLLLHQQLSKSSVRKYAAVRDMVCADGRVRGLFQFYGAARSGRWAGRGVQLQNLPQNHLEPLGDARSLVLREDSESVGLVFGSVPDVLSELVRTAFVPSPGMKFIVADFSAIEARVLAWLAGETWRSEVFASGGDIYCASASRMFHVPVEKHGLNGHLRQKGKVAELALGYGGGVGALKAMGAVEMGVPEEELQGLVDAWRAASPNIVRLWRNVDRMTKTVIRDRTSLRLGALKFSCRARMLFITLPSGRSLSYAKPEVFMNPRFGSEAVRFMGVNAARKWAWVETFGAKLVENIVQGISRDLLAEAMLRIAGEGYRIVAHVHDEVIVEAGPGTEAGNICSLMDAVPPWAGGLALRADGYECEYYRKD